MITVVYEKVVWRLHTFCTVEPRNNPTISLPTSQLQGDGVELDWQQDRNYDDIVKSLSHVALSNLDKYSVEISSTRNVTRRRRLCFLFTLPCSTEART